MPQRLLLNPYLLFFGINLLNRSFHFVGINYSRLYRFNVLNKKRMERSSHFSPMFFYIKLCPLLLYSKLFLFLKYPKLNKNIGLFLLRR